MNKHDGYEYDMVDCSITKYYSATTAASCFSEKVQENQGLWEFKKGFLYQIYDRKLRFGAVTWLKKE